MSETNNFANENLAKINAALARIGSPLLETVSTAAGGTVELARICAVHDRCYVVHYRRDARGKFRLVETMRVQESAGACGPSPAEAGDEVSCADWQVETCPWCGTSGRGSVRCGTCKAEICYGRTERDHFRCRKSCGGEGAMVPGLRTQRGIKRVRGNPRIGCADVKLLTG